MTTLHPDMYVLPPPRGVGNDLYEAYPQAGDTVFDRGGPFFNPLGAAPQGKSSGASPLNAKTVTAIAISAATGDPTAAIGAIAAPGNDAATPTNAAGNSSGVVATANNFLVRGAVIILGFIFVGIGLSMFRTPIVIRSPTG